MRLRMLPASCVMAACVLALAVPSAAQCEPDGDIQFVCGPVSPEDLALADAPGPATIRGQLVLAEVLGATTHLHVEVGSRRLIAAVPSGPSPAPAGAVSLSIDPRWLHFFAADGSSLLRHSPSPFKS